jgi:hypothetical protein
MNISDEAAAMYARACRAWYGPRAQGVVRKKISSWNGRETSRVFTLGRKWPASFPACLHQNSNVSAGYKEAPQLAGPGQG